MVRSGAVVAKAHAADSDREALAARLALASAPELTGILLPPLSTPDTPGTAGTALRPVTFWPYGVPVDPRDPDAAPWAAAAALLARLHRTAPPPPLPPMRGPVKAARAVARMIAALPGDGAVLPVQAAWRALPDWARGEVAPPPHGRGSSVTGTCTWGSSSAIPPRTVPGCSSMWTTRVGGSGLGPRPPRRLVRGRGAGPAGLAAVPGRLPVRRGPAVPAEGDPWPQLDVAARALTVQTAAVALAKCAAEGRVPDEMEQLMIDSCARIATFPPELAAGSAS